MSGWIKLHRKTLDSCVFGDADLLKLWVYCLLKASHKEREILVDKQTVKIEPGQFITGRFELEADFNKGTPARKKISGITLQRWLRKLETMGNLNIKTTTKYTIITVVNWDQYQEVEQQMNNKRTTDEQQVNTNKNVKKGKNVKKDLYGEFVRLEKGEYEKLVDRLGEPSTLDYIDRLNNYIGSSGKRYKSHYHTILTWVRKDEAKKPSEPNRKLDIYIPEVD